SRGGRGDRRAGARRRDRQPAARADRAPRRRRVRSGGVQGPLRAHPAPVHGSRVRRVSRYAASHAQRQGRSRRTRARGGGTKGREVTELTATEARIRDFLLEDVLYDRQMRELAVDENLLEKGLLDSLAIFKVVTFCEEQFGVTIPDQDVLPDNMESVRAIAALVDRTRAK